MTAPVPIQTIKWWEIMDPKQWIDCNKSTIFLLKTMDNDHICLFMFKPTRKKCIGCLKLEWNCINNGSSYHITLIFMDFCCFFNVIWLLDVFFMWCCYRSKKTRWIDETKLLWYSIQLIRQYWCVWQLFAMCIN